MVETYIALRAPLPDDVFVDPVDGAHYFQQSRRPCGKENEKRLVGLQSKIWEYLLSRLAGKRKGGLMGPSVRRISPVE